MKTIAVFFGGMSTEHDVSIITALASVIKPLELSREFNVEPVYISREGKWYTDSVLKDIRLFSSGRIDEFLAKAQPAGVELGGGMTLLKPGGIRGTRRIKVDVAFPAMHGTYGEDGKLMGVFEMAGIPYAGCNVQASALAMDKVSAKTMAKAHGIQTSQFRYFTRNAVQEDMQQTIEDITSHLQYPLFVKPANLGSSIGITRASDRNGLVNALEVAAHYDEKIIVEEAVNNLIEVTLPILGNENPRPALLEKPLSAAEDFFDFDTKYMHGGKKGGKKGGAKGAQGYSQLPAELPKDLYEKAESTGLAVYRALGCSGTARVDMLIDGKTGEVYFNEVNPLPGSLYAHNWRQAGVSGVDLVRTLVSLAEERFNREKDIARTFETSYLKQF